MNTAIDLIKKVLKAVKVGNRRYGKRLGVTHPIIKAMEKFLQAGCPENASEIIQMAQDDYCEDGKKIEIDDDATISRYEHPQAGGAYVEAWVWVDFPNCDSCNKVFVPGKDYKDIDAPPRYCETCDPDSKKEV